MKDSESNQVYSHTPHPIKNILSSRQPAMVLFKYVLVLIVALMGLLGFQLIAQSLMRPAVYRKDFIQEYLLARSILADVDPYLPLTDLASRFMGPLPSPVPAHPTPHPPPVALISLPLGLLDYQQAAVAWAVFEIICIIVAVYMLLRWLGLRPGIGFTLFITLLAVAWTALRDEVAIGQLMTLLLVLLVGSWLALRSGRNFVGGILTGGLIALKLMAWPVVIYLVLRRNWRAVLAAGGTAAVAHLGAGVLIGFDRIWYYYREVSSIVSPLYRAHEANFSIWTIGWRLFEGADSTVLYELKAAPLLDMPALAPYVSLAMPLMLLGTGLALALQIRNFDAAFGILVCVSLLANPVTWHHYLILASVPLVMIGRRLFTLDFPNKETWAFILLGLMMFMPYLGLSWLGLILTGNEPTVSNPQAPFAATLLILLPAMEVLGLLWLTWHIERVYPAKGG